MNHFSKNQLIKLGDRLRQESETKEFSEDSLSKLQDFRTSFKNDIATVFTILSEESRRTRRSRVVTYRLKRIESIISKLNRFPNMELGKMVDVAGCRCILDSISDIQNVRDAIERELHVFDCRDYITTKDQDGYSALHLYVKTSPESKRPIEIQLRTRDQHNWATMVEIIDTVFETKIKEGEKHTELERFCLLMSDFPELTHKQKTEIIRLEQKHEIYPKISSVFRSNYLRVRSQWLQIEQFAGHSYFVIEVDEEKKTNIISFDNFEEAENTYYQMFTRSKTNIVLTHLDRPNFKQISMAYSNYILSVHKFQEDICKIASDCIETLKSRNKLKYAREIAEVYQHYIEQETEAFNTEYKLVMTSVGMQNNDKFNEWIEDITQRAVDRGEILAQSKRGLELSLGEQLTLFISNLIKSMFSKDQRAAHD